MDPGELRLAAMPPDPPEPAGIIMKAPLPVGTIITGCCIMAMGAAAGAAAGVLPTPAAVTLPSPVWALTMEGVLALFMLGETVVVGPAMLVVGPATLMLGDTVLTLLLLTLLLSETFTF